MRSAEAPLASLLDGGPEASVLGGAYRAVRNPMYVANVAIFLVFGAWELVAWATVVLVAFHVFVVIYEEPTLKRTSAATVRILAAMLVAAVVACSRPEGNEVEVGIDTWRVIGT